MLGLKTKKAEIEKALQEVDGFTVGEKVVHRGQVKTIEKFGKRDSYGDIPAIFREGGKADTDRLTKEVEVKEFEAIKSRCLTCVNAFSYRYLPNPENSKLDPLIVACKLPIMNKVLQEHNSNMHHECWDDYWYRKCVSCSEYKEVNNGQ